MKKKSKAKAKPSKSKAKPRKWKVEHNYSYGWDDAQWTENDQPQRFNSKKEAEAAIREFIRDQHDAVKSGDMDEKYRRSDYRAVPADDDDLLDD